MKHLHTGQFKQVYKEVKTPLPYVNFLILGLLVWLEQKYLDYTIKANLDSAIDDYHKQMDRLKKWHKFERSIYVVGWSHLPHCLLQYNIAFWDAWVRRFQWDARQQGRIWLVRRIRHTICWRYSLTSHATHTHVVSNKMCGTAQILIHSHFGLL